MKQITVYVVATSLEMAQQKAEVGDFVLLKAGAHRDHRMNQRTHAGAKWRVFEATIEINCIETRTTT